MFPDFVSSVTEELGTLKPVFDVLLDIFLHVGNIISNFNTFDFRQLLSHLDVTVDAEAQYDACIGQRFDWSIQQSIDTTA